MKTFRQLLIPALLLAALAGCTPAGSANNTAHEREENAEFEDGVTFNAKRGLSVSAETARFIDLRLADVEERPVKSEFRFSAQVYRANGDPRPASLSLATRAEPILASADLNPQDAKFVRQGQSVTVELDHGNSLPGRIAEIHPHNERSGAHMDVTIAIDSKQTQLRPGSFVAVKVPVGGEKPVVSVPRAALLQTAEGEFVYTANGEYFVRTAVKVGVMNEEYVEITDGLYAGDKIVVNPVMTLWMAELQSIRGGKACADGH